MRASKSARSGVGLLLLVGGFYTYFFAGPWRFVERPLWQQGLQHLSSSATAASSPADAADGEEGDFQNIFETIPSTYVARLNASLNL
jgi:hypothetical protein